MQEIIGGGKRYHDKCDQQQAQHESPVLTDGKYLLVCTVSAFNLAVFTIEHRIPGPLVAA